MIELAKVRVERPDEFRACCDDLARHSRIGFDTEFIGEATYHPNLCLVQVATTERLYVIDPQTVGALDRFWELVTDPERMIVVHAGREEIRIGHQACGRTPVRLFDLQIAAGLVGIGYPLGYADSRYPRDRLLFADRIVSPASDRRPDGRCESLRGRHEPRSSVPDRSPTPKIGPALRLFVDR